MVKRENGYPEEEYALIIMDNFKGQDNDRLRVLPQKTIVKFSLVLTL